MKKKVDQKNAQVMVLTNESGLPMANNMAINNKDLVAIVIAKQEKDLKNHELNLTQQLKELNIKLARVEEQAFSKKFNDKMIDDILKSDAIQYEKELVEQMKKLGFGDKLSLDATFGLKNILTGEMADHYFFKSLLKWAKNEDGYTIAFTVKIVDDKNGTWIHSKTIHEWVPAEDVMEVINELKALLLQKELLSNDIVKTKQALQNISSLERQATAEITKATLAASAEGQNMLDILENFEVPAAFKVSNLSSSMEVK